LIKPVLPVGKKSSEAKNVQSVGENLRRKEFER